MNATPYESMQTTPCMYYGAIITPWLQQVYILERRLLLNHAVSTDAFQLGNIRKHHHAT
jgi:hypothetical protein